MRISSKTVNSISLFQYGILIIVLFILVLFTSESFRAVNESKNNNYNYRAQLAYISNKVKSSNFTDGVELENSEYGSVLILKDVDEKSEYNTKIYSYNGSILEEYSKAGQAPNPQKADTIGNSAVFDVKINQGLLYLTTDFGTAAIEVRV